MRISFGKKIGSTYVGTSANATTLGKIVFYFFTWPLILCYFIFVWPIVKLYQRNKRKKQANYLVSEKTVNVDGHSISMSPAEARGAIPIYKKIAEESTKIIQETKNPDIYFKRYDMAIKNFEYLSAAYQVCGIDNNVPDMLQKLKNNYVMHTNQLVDRYAQDTRRKIYDLTSIKAKDNKAEAFKNVLMEYKDRLEKESIQYIENKYTELKRLAR